MVRIKSEKLEKLPKDSYYIIGFDETDYPKYLGVNEFMEYITFDTFEDNCGGEVKFSLGCELTKDEFENKKEITKDEFVKAFNEQLKSLSKLMT